MYAISTFLEIEQLNNLSFAIVTSMCTIYALLFIFKKSEYDISYLTLLLEVKLKGNNGYIFLGTLIGVIAIKIIDFQRLYLKFSEKLEIYDTLKVFISLGLFIMTIICFWTMYTWIKEFNNESDIEELVIKFLKKNSEKINILPKNSEKIDYNKIIETTCNDKQEKDKLKQLKDISNDVYSFYKVSYLLTEKLLKKENSALINKIEENLNYWIKTPTISSDKKEILKEFFLLTNKEDCKNKLIIFLDRNLIKEILSDGQFVKNYENIAIQLCNKISNKDLIELISQNKKIEYEENNLFAKVLLGKKISDFKEIISELITYSDEKKLELFINILFEKMKNKSDNEQQISIILRALSNLLIYKRSGNTLEKNSKYGLHKKLESNLQIRISEEKITKNCFDNIFEKEKMLLDKMIACESPKNLILLQEYINDIEEYFFMENSIITESKINLAKRYEKFKRDINKQIENYNFSYRSDYNKNYHENGVITYSNPFEISNSKININNLNISILENEESQITDKITDFIDENTRLLNRIYEELSKEKIKSEIHFEKLLDAIGKDNLMANILFIQFYDVFFENNDTKFNIKLSSFLAREFSTINIPSIYGGLFLNIQSKILYDYCDETTKFRDMNLPINIKNEQINYFRNFINTAIKIECFSNSYNVHEDNIFILKLDLEWLKKQKKDLKIKNLVIGSYSINKYKLDEIRDEKKEIISHKNIYFKSYKNSYKYLEMYLNDEKITDVNYKEILDSADKTNLKSNDKEGNGVLSGLKKYLLDKI